MANGPHTIRVEGMDVEDVFDSPMYTFGFVKPHAYPHRDYIMADIERISSSTGSPLYIVRSKDDHLTREAAEEHYKVHRDRPFFAELIDMITAGPIHEFLLVGRDAIPNFRSILGATDPKKVEPGTIRHKYGESQRGIAYNAVHGSDSLESFLHEVMLHFTREELGELFWARIDSYDRWLREQKSEP